MKMKSLFFGLVTLGASALILSCSSSKSDPAPPLVSATFNNLPADPPTGYNPTNGQPIGVTKKFTFFNFSTGSIVANADSASTKWDLGFNATTIIVNNGTSGPGFAAAQIVSGIYDQMILAPSTGYNTDNKNNTGAPYAIPKGSGNGWYSYDQTSNVISPIAGRVLMVKTGDGKHYAKMEIISYYKDAPASPNNTSLERYYTFRYAYQPNGTRNFQ